MTSKYFSDSQFRNSASFPRPSKLSNGPTDVCRQEIKGENYKCIYSENKKKPHNILIHRVKNNNIYEIRFSSTSRLLMTSGIVMIRKRIGIQKYVKAIQFKNRVIVLRNTPQS